VITRAQVADLQPGDTVEVKHPEWQGGVIRGPVYKGDGFGMSVAGYLLVRTDRSVSDYLNVGILTVVSRAPRPLYVNHPRTEPVAGDVMIPTSHASDDVVTWSWCPLQSGKHRWRATDSDTWLDAEDVDDDLLLLVDGETGQVVP